MADNAAAPMPETTENGIHTTVGTIKNQIVDNLLELRKDEGEAEVLKICRLNSIKGENKENLLKFYRAEKKDQDRRVKVEENQKEESDLIDTYRTIIPATDPKEMYEQLKEHIKEAWLETREDTAIAFIKEIWALRCFMWVA